MEKKLGTFLGVYTPAILTILGVIMYLRFGWLVGHLGVDRVLLLVVIANSITLLTALSLSAVATNARVGAGGAYHMISRSLGIEIGGAVGLPLFLSQSVSITLYSFGLAESLRIVWPEVPVQMATLAIVVLVGALALLGAKLALTTQLPLLGLVAVSLFALAIGALTRSAPAPAAAAGGELGFWAGFAIFFPAVTGVMAGLGLSGDLEDPGRSIPLGSMLAALTGLVIYLVVPMLLGRAASADQLRAEPLIWSRIAVFGPWLVFPGLWSAIFSSAVGSALGAPRTLHALARDGLAARWLVKPTGDRRALVPGLLVSLAIAVAAVFLGDLNAVAVVVSMFFLTVYGTVNLAAAFEALSGDPSWRPKIHVPWPLTLAGGLACVAVMFLINPLAGALAIIAELGLWLLLSRREQRASWGDARRGLYEALIRWALIRLAHRPVTARNWRPHILVFVDGPIRELDLVRFATWFSQGRGLVTVCELEVGDLMQGDFDLVPRRRQMQETLNREGLAVFAEVDVVPSVVEGIVDVAQANGMAGVSSNTILLGWPRDPVLRVDFFRVMRQLEQLKKSLILGRIRPRHLFRREGIAPTIHIWWGGLQRNGDLMLLLAYLLTRNPGWRHAEVKVLSIASTELMKTQTESYLLDLIPRIRIDAAPEVVIKPRETSVADLIKQKSQDAEVVFLGLATPAPGEEEAYAQRLENLAGDLPTVFFVKNASLFIGALVATADAGLEEERQAPPPPPPSASTPG